MQLLSPLTEKHYLTFDALFKAVNLHTARQAGSGGGGRQAGGQAVMYRVEDLHVT